MKRPMRLCHSTLGFCVGLVLTVALSSCGRELISKELPASGDLGEPRGYKIARTIIHTHTSYSYDACDKSLEKNGVIDAGCNADVRKALCFNHIDFAFLTDHPWAMTEYEFPALMLNKTGDTLTYSGPDPIMNTLGDCDTYNMTDPATPRVMVGFESSMLMPIGMKKHIGGNSAERSQLYIANTSAALTTIKAQSGALVMVPHTEEQDMAKLSTLGMDGIEIYNFHANMDPKRREHDLGLRPFKATFAFFPYLFDLNGQEQPDLAFVSLFDYSPVYGQRWDTLLSQGLKVTGFGGTDSHQNAVRNRTRDGERADAHRRLMRWMSNHFLVNSMTYDDIMDAVKKGRGWVVFEGLGSPDGMDFYARVNGTNVSVGETATYVANQTLINVALPTLDAKSPSFKFKPVITIRLYRVKSDGVKELVASSADQALSYSVPAAGIYRAEVSIVPHHLRWYIITHASLTSEEFPWIITNPIYLE